jgi:hypothetical protein
VVRLADVYDHKVGSNYQILWLDVSVQDFPEESVVLLVLDVEDETAVLVLILGTDVKVITHFSFVTTVAKLRFVLQLWSYSMPVLWCPPSLPRE